jgi:hypothetical protein
MGIGSSYLWFVTASKPASMHDAMDLVGSLTDEMVRNGALGVAQVGEKRKWDNRKQGNNNYRKPANTVKNYAVATPEKTPYAGNYPNSDKCNYHHRGERMTCEKCKRTGHLAKNFREGTDGKRVCYECGNPNHIKYHYPRRQGNQNNGGKNGNPARGRAFVIGAKDARDDPYVVSSQQ